MPVTDISILLFLGALAAGLLGALTGLGGGAIIVPLLTILFHVDIRYAVGTSLVSVIATSSGAAAAYVKEGYSNIRVGMLLEIATTIGAITGAYIAALVSPTAVAVIFGIVLLHTAWTSTRPRVDHISGGASDPIALKFRLDSTFPTANGPQHYQVQRVPLGFGLMYIAGVLSGLLGIGSGVVKVLAMDRAMHLPFKVSTTTSNFMIGVTAAASAGIYLHRGYIVPGLAFPVMLGVLAGALAGARMLPHLHTQKLRVVFSVLVAALAVELLLNAFTGKI